MATVYTPWVQNPKPGIGGGGFTLRRRELSENLQRHHQAVGAAVPTVSTWNAEHVTLTTQARHNRGVNRVREARQAEIKRLNNLLVDRITDTALKSSSVQPETYPASGHRRPHTHRSLNYVARKRERDRIARDNLALAKRILDKKPVLQHEHWDKHSQIHDRLLGNIAKFTEVPIHDTDTGMMAADVESTSGANSGNGNDGNRSVTPRGGMLRPLSDQQRRAAFEKLNADREATNASYANGGNGNAPSSGAISAPHTARRHQAVAPLAHHRGSSTQRQQRQRPIQPSAAKDNDEKEIAAGGEVGYHDVHNDEKESTSLSPSSSGTLAGGRRGRRVVSKPKQSTGVRWDYQTVAAMYPEALPGHTYFRLARTEAFLAIDAAGTGVDLSPIIDNNAAWLTVPILPISPSPATVTANSKHIDPACYAWRLQLLDGSHSLYHLSTSTVPNLYLTSHETNGSLHIHDTPTDLSVWRLDPDGRGLIRNEKTQQYLAASATGELYVSPHPDVWGQYCAQWRMAGPMGSQCLHSARLPICVLPQRERRMISAAPFDASALPSTATPSATSASPATPMVQPGTVGVQHAATQQWLVRTPEGGVTLSATTAADPSSSHWMMARDAHGGQWLRACGSHDGACLLATMERPSPPRVPQPPSSAQTDNATQQQLQPPVVARRLQVVAPRIGDQPWLVIAPPANATATPSPPPAVAGQL